MYYVCLEQKWLSRTRTTPNATHLTQKGRLGEVTRGQVQRAVPKSAHCWGLHAIWGYGMTHRVPVMPLIRFIYYIHTSEPEFFSRAKLKSGRQSHRSRKPALNTHRKQCSVHVSRGYMSVHQKLKQGHGSKRGGVQESQEDPRQFSLRK